jgi:3-keto-5-aminohexanoate cleavage enzyme
MGTLLPLRRAILSPQAPEALMMMDALPKVDDIILNVSGIGRAQTVLTSLGMLLGANVRVGMEDNIYYGKGALAKSNAQMVARAVRIAREIGYEIASPKEAREILGVPYKTY